KGQLVLPKAVRDRLGVGPGSKIVLAERRGRIELEAYGGDILSFYGALEVSGPQDWDAVKRETEKARAREVVRESESD
ncbi:MAG: AbrB/MazE/SpoVT family DNA-binding domain-containing protein, partial [Acidobacteria bacterium]|nr:AbrB/MazE/SpoVT family DNA-binding domain-containing protein [Acidobacteriota bacterium]